MATPTTVLPEIEPSTGTESGFAPDQHGLPEIADPGAVNTTEARELSRVLLLRLRQTEQGTELHSYVRGTLIELDRFDPNRGVEFTTFALPTIIGEIRRFFRDSTWAVHVPRRLQEARLAVVRASDELEQDLGRAPSEEELAEFLALPQDEVVEALAVATARTATSLDAPLDGGEADSARECRLGRCDSALAVVEDVQSLKPLIAELPERERTILALRFTQDLTQGEIGHRLGISQMHVSRLLAHSFQVLRSGLADGQDAGSEAAHGG